MTLTSPEPGRARPCLRFPIIVKLPGFDKPPPAARRPVEPTVTAQCGCAAAPDRLRHSELAKKDYYQVLGVKETASARAIERAYWNMARACHKKSARSKSAKRRLLTLNEAYENLASPAKRKAYDRQRRQPQEPKATRGLWGLLRHLRPGNGRFRDPPS